MTLDIMMPFYGRFDHLQEAVRSVLAQSDDDWRLIVVDDAYPDPAPGEWVRGLGDDRVGYVRNATNLGVSGNFTRCLELAESEFLVFMGCDDVLDPGYVARVTTLLSDHPGADIVQPGVRIIDEDGEPVRPLADRVKVLYRETGDGPRELSGERLARSLLRGNWLYFPSLVWRRSRLGTGFRSDLVVVQDLAMILEITYAGGVLVVDDEVVFAYRRHRASVSSAAGPDGARFEEERELFRDAERRCRERGWTRAARAARWHLSSRLHALSELPRARRDPRSVRVLLRHGFGPLSAAGRTAGAARRRG